MRGDTNVVLISIRTHRYMARCVCFRDQGRAGCSLLPQWLRDGPWMAGGYGSHGSHLIPSLPPIQLNPFRLGASARQGAVIIAHVMRALRSNRHSFLACHARSQQVPLRHGVVAALVLMFRSLNVSQGNARRPPIIFPDLVARRPPAPKPWYVASQAPMAGLVSKSPQAHDWLAACSEIDFDCFEGIDPWSEKLGWRRGGWPWPLGNSSART